MVDHGEGIRARAPSCRSRLSRAGRRHSSRPRPAPCTPKGSRAGPGLVSREEGNDERRRVTYG